MRKLKKHILQFHNQFISYLYSYLTLHQLLSLTTSQTVCNYTLTSLYLTAFFCLYPNIFIALKMTACTGHVHALKVNACQFACLEYNTLGCCSFFNGCETRVLGDPGMHPLQCQHNKQPLQQLLYEYRNQSFPWNAGFTLLPWKALQHPMVL